MKYLSMSGVLNPGRYIAAATPETDGIDFRARLEELNKGLGQLSVEAVAIQERIALNVTELLG
jgi:hypothetical protein